MTLITTQPIQGLHTTIVESITSTGTTVFERVTKNAHSVPESSQYNLHFSSSPGNHGDSVVVFMGCGYSCEVLDEKGLPFSSDILQSKNITFGKHFLLIHTIIKIK